MLNAILEGQVQMMFTNVLPVLPFIRSGRLIPLLLSTTERLPTLPDVPTAAETGISDFVVGFCRGAGTQRHTAAGHRQARCGVPESDAQPENQ